MIIFYYSWNTSLVPKTLILQDFCSDSSCTMEKMSPQQDDSACNEDHPTGFTCSSAYVSCGEPIWGIASQSKDSANRSQYPIPVTAKYKHVMNIYKLGMCWNDFFNSRWEIKKIVDNWNENENFFYYTKFFTIITISNIGEFFTVL
jgi:hypothetical protein